MPRLRYGRGPLLVLGVVLLAGCGFHLRGAVQLPSVMERTYLQDSTPNNPLAEEVRTVLEGAGGQVVAQLKEATAILVLKGERTDRRVAGVNSSGQARAYELRYSFEFSLLNPAGEVLLPAQTVTRTRTYNFDPQNVLGTASEEQIMVREMRRAAVRQMVRQVSVASREALQPRPAEEKAGGAGGAH